MQRLLKNGAKLGYGDAGPGFEPEDASLDLYDFIENLSPKPKRFACDVPVPLLAVKLMPVSRADLNTDRLRHLSKPFHWIAASPSDVYYYYIIYNIYQTHQRTCAN